MPGLVNQPYFSRLHMHVRKGRGENTLYYIILLYGWFKRLQYALTTVVEAQLIAYHLSILAVPEIVTYGAPLSR